MVAGGNHKGHILLVLDAPRPEEVEFKRPLCYEDGLYLQSSMIQAKFEYGDCFITYAVCCTMPEPKQIAVEDCSSCFGHLWKTIEFFDPRLIITVGSAATGIVCNSKKSISSLQGEIQRVGPYRVMPIFHPSFMRLKGTKLQVKAYVQTLKSARELVFA
jgi:DNA polymerase